MHLLVILLLTVCLFQAEGFRRRKLDASDASDEVVEKKRGRSTKEDYAVVTLVGTHTHMICAASEEAS